MALTPRRLAGSTDTVGCGAQTTYNSIRAGVIEDEEQTSQIGLKSWTVSMKNTDYSVLFRSSNAGRASFGDSTHWTQTSGR